MAEGKVKDLLCWILNSSARKPLIDIICRDGYRSEPKIVECKWLSFEFSFSDFLLESYTDILCFLNPWPYSTSCTSRKEMPFGLKLVGMWINNNEMYKYYLFVLWLHSLYISSPKSK